MFSPLHRPKNQFLPLLRTDGSGTESLRLGTADTGGRMTLWGYPRPASLSPPPPQGQEPPSRDKHRYPQTSPWGAGSPQFGSSALGGQFL